MSKAKKITIKPGHLPVETVDFYTKLLAQYHLLNANNPSRLVDSESLTESGVRLPRNAPPAPQFIVLVDRREKGHKSSSPIVGCVAMCVTLLRLGIWAVPWTLPDKRGDYALLEYEGNDTEDVVVSSSSSGRKRRKIVVDDDGDDTEGSFPPGYKVWTLIERKTRADLQRSIVDHHRTDQRDIMLLTGVPVIMWLITEYVDEVVDGWLKRLQSAILHETFSLDGLTTGQKTCALQVRSDASVPDTISGGMRWLVEDIIKKRRKDNGTQLPTAIGMGEYTARLKHKGAGPAQTYAAALCLLVKGLGEAHALAIQKEFPTLLHLTREALEATNPAKRIVLVKRLSYIKCGPVLLSTGDDKSRRLGLKTAEKLVDALLDPYVEFQHGYSVTTQQTGKSNNDEIMDPVE